MGLFHCDVAKRDWPLSVRVTTGSRSLVIAMSNPKLRKDLATATPPTTTESDCRTYGNRDLRAGGNVCALYSCADNLENSVTNAHKNYLHILKSYKEKLNATISCAIAGAPRGTHVAIIAELTPACSASDSPPCVGLARISTTHETAENPVCLR